MHIISQNMHNTNSPALWLQYGGLSFDACVLYVIWALARAQTPILWPFINLDSPPTNPPQTLARPLIYLCRCRLYIYIIIYIWRDNSWGALFSQGLSCGQKISPTANCPVGGVWHGLFEFFWKSHVTTWSRDQNLKVKYLENQSRYGLLQPLIWKVGWRGIYGAIWKISVTSLSRDSHVIKT